ncbi:hypothetical protein ACHAWC_002357, partial [Mediolabrus comicus]
NALLNASVHCATKLANTSESEVHVILTGSPRPTFAETNAWLLEGTAQSSSSSASPKRMKVSNSEMMNNDDNRPAHLKGSYSIADNVHYSSSNMDIDDENNNYNEEDDTEMQDDNNNNTVLQEYINEFTNNSSTPNANMNDLASSPGVKTGESVLRDFQARKLSEADMSGSSSNTTPVHNNSFVRRNTTGVTFKDNNDESNNKNSRRRSTFDSQSNNNTNNSGPMVGQAVVNAISQSSGVGLQSSRSKLLQGTIDRPLWSQTRWTDGECLFSELVDLCGLESFENSGAAGSHHHHQGSSGPDAAAGGAGSKLQKTTNLSANLITVPATTLHEPDAGVSQTTIEEIARGIIRTLKRKSSPPASNVYIVLPPDFTEGSKRELLVTLLKQSYEKLEHYNHMIGQPVLMGGAELKFVNIE